MLDYDKWCNGGVVRVAYTYRIYAYYFNSAILYEWCLD